MDYTFLHSTILTWFDNNQKVYPWRSESPHPYHVLLYEYMLQQTQAYRIALKFPEFLNTFPTIEKLCIYFSRHGYLLELDINQWTSNENFTEFEKWFFERAVKYLNSPS